MDTHQPIKNFIAYSPKAKESWYIPTIGLALILLAIWGISQCNKTQEKPFDFSAKMVFVQGGTFQMGDSFGDGYSNEKPVHSVTLSSFYIGETEVRQAEWREVMGSDPPELYHIGCDNCPVESVSWYDIQEFLKKLNEKTGQQYRLPTEAEWEYAARGGAQSKGFRYAGSNEPGSVAWYRLETTQAVKDKEPNELGLYDMSGNVWEWCQDWYDANYYKNSPSSNPVNNTKASERVLRGGSWYDTYDQCRVSYRDFIYLPVLRFNYVGFRVARDL